MKLASFAAILCLFGALSCSKNSNNKTNNSCKIVALYDTTTLPNGQKNTHSEILTYNNDGKIASSQYFNGNQNSTVTFAYGDHLIIAVPSSGVVDSIYLNNDGLPSKMIQKGTTALTTSTYIYSGTQLQNMLIVQKIGNASSTYNYSYSFANGDNTSAVANVSLNDTYTYYTDKPSSIADPRQFPDYISFGVSAIRNAHLVKSRQEPNASESYTYTFDNTGKILTCTITYSDNTKEVETFVYDCN